MTGSSTLLDELAFVRQMFPTIDAQTLLSMVTETAAELLGFADVGQIKVGAYADLLVFGGSAGSREEAALRVVEAGLDDLRLVTIEGFATYGDEDLMTQLSSQTGPQPERLQIPYRSTTLDRLLRFDSGCGGFHPMCERLVEGGVEHLAPLWEAD